MDNSVTTPQVSNTPPVNQQQVQPNQQTQNVVNTKESASDSGGSDFSEKPGGVWYRYWASIIDALIIGIPSSVITLLFVLITFMGISELSIGTNQVRDVFITILYFILYFSYYIYLTSKNGATIGKDAYGMKVVDIESKRNITFKSSFIRELVKIGPLFIPVIGTLFYFINGLVTLFSSNKRGFHDKSAKTQVLVVKKPWPFGKQILVFGALLLLTLGPVIITLFRYFQDAQGMDQLSECVNECMDNSLMNNLEMGADDVGEYESCLLECQ
ncbi:RDD family protein [Patescibacteria group bacterium]